MDQCIAGVSLKKIALRKLSHNGIENDKLFSKAIRINPESSNRG